MDTKIKSGKARRAAILALGDSFMVGIGGWRGRWICQESAGGKRRGQVRRFFMYSE